MSTTVDNRVVQMRFDNANFESGVKQSLSTLDKLKSALNFTGASKGLVDVGTAAASLSSFGLSSIASSISGVADRFSNLGVIGMTVLQHLTEEAISAGERIVKSLTIDQVNAGWTKYADKTTAVQTIMAATASQFSDTATQMAYVNDQLSKLNWFTDETSYNFVDMVGNIGKFTSNGIPLAEAVTSMQGIANWAAISGQNAQTASRAMYNLAQAIGTGSVKLIDWRSIENANMATQEFKQTVLDAAVDMKTLTKASNGTYQTLKGTTVSVQDFNTALSEGWFNKAVLTSVLDKYGAVTNKLYNLSEASGATATDILSLVDAQKAGTLTTEMLQEAMDGSLISVEEFKTGIEELGSSENEFGLKTFKAAQEAKTFADAIDATADAASTAWMNIFETIFGDYMQAKSVWTDFANFLYDTMVSPLESVQELLDGWAGMGGRDVLLSALKEIGPAVSTYIAPIKEAFRDIFPAKTADDLLQFTHRLRNLFINMKLSEENAEKLRSVFKGLFSAVDIVKKAFSGLLNAMKPLKEPLKTLGNNLLDVVVKAADFITGFNEKFKISSSLRDFFTTVGKWITSFAEDIPSALSKVKSAFDGFNVGDKLTNLKETFKNTFSGLFKEFDDEGNVTRTKGIIEGLVDGIVKVFGKLKTALQPVGDVLKKTWEGIKQWSSDNLTAGGILKLSTAFLVLKKALGKDDGIKGAIKGFLSNISDKFGDIVEGATKALSSLKKALSAFSISSMATNLLKVGAAVALLAASLVALSMCDPNKLAIGIGALAAGMMILIGTLNMLSGIGGGGEGGILSKILTGGSSLSSAGSAILLASAGLLLLAGAMAAFALVVTMPGFADGLISMMVSLGAVTVALELLAKTCSAGSLLAAATAIAVTSAALLVLAGAMAAFSLVAMMPGFVDGLLGMAIGLGVVTLALELLSNTCGGGKLLAASAAILIASAAMIELAAALAILSAINPERLGGAMESFAASIIIVSAALGVLTILGPGVLIAAAALVAASASMLVIAAAMTVFAVAMQLMDGVNWERSALGLTEMAGGMALFTAASVAFLVAIPGLAGAAVTFTTLAAALGLVTGPIQKLSNANVGEIASGMVALAGSFAGLAVGTAVLTALSPAIKTFSKNLENFGDSSADAVSASSGLTSMFETLIGLSSEFVSSVNNAIAAANNLINGIIQALSSATSSMSVSGQNLAISFINAFGSYNSYASTAGYNLGASAYNGVNAYTGSFYTVGYNMAIGTGNGVNNGSGYVYNACVGMVINALNGARAAAQIRSPSRKFANLVGKYIPLGTAKGIDDYSNVVTDATVSMVGNSLKTVTSTLSTIADAMNENADFEPVITPVVDLSGVKTGSKQIEDIIGSNNISVGMSGEIQKQYYKNQNAAAQDSHVVASIDPVSLAAILSQGQMRTNPKVNVSFNGSLAQLAAVLQPAIELETERLGPSLIKS